LKELEDYDWFPVALRNFQTDFIGFVVARFNMYNAFTKYLKTFSLAVKPSIDLCSGAGEPAISIFKKTNCFSFLTLSDKYPNQLQVKDERIIYTAKSEDVLDMKFKPEIYYTLFNAFHHFSDENKLKIVRKILEADSVAFIVEILQPRFFCFVKIFFATTIGTLFIMPFVKPFSFKRLFFTYIIPVNVFTIAFDGMVSVFKSRSAVYYQKLFSGFGNSIEVVNLKNGFNSLIVIHVKQRK
jgi:hypothetical protein